MLSPLCRTYTVILSLRNTGPGDNSCDVTIDASFCVEALNLQLLKLYKELFDKFVKNIVAFSHEFSSLFFGHLARFIYLGLFKVRKDQYKDTLGIP